MFMSGVELSRSRTIKYCSEYYCNKLIPLCAVCVSADCCESVSKWCHISAGEHVCSVCYSKILSLFSYDKKSDEILEWKRDWFKHSHENPTVNDYIVEQLISQWCFCTKCGKWRQICRDLRLTPDKIENFKCSLIFSHKSPCQTVEDERVEFIKKHIQEFFESIKYQPLLETNPFIDMYDSYGLDLVGISPTAKSKHSSIYKCPDFMVKFNPYLKRNQLEMAAGSIDPACMEIWEHEMFPIFNGNLRNIFIGLRNLMLSLWAADPKRVINEVLLNKYLLLPGIVRVPLMANIIPDMIRVYSGLGYINYCFVDPPVKIFDQSLRIIIIDGNYSGLPAANHLARLGANVTVLEEHDISSTQKFFDITKEVQGCINNPLITAAYQLNIEMHKVGNYFTLFNHDGQIINDDIDKYLQDFVYDFIDYMAEELNAITNSTVPVNCSLQDIFYAYKSKKFDYVTYSDYIHVIDTYLAELEYRLFGGASMNNVTTKFQLNNLKRNCSNFDVKDFCGDIMEPVESWNILCENLLSRHSEIHYCSKVQSITKNADVYVVSTDDMDYEADKIILTMEPWDIMKINIADDILIITDDVKDVGRRVGNLHFDRTLIVVKMVYDVSDAFWREKCSSSSSWSMGGIFAIASPESSERCFCHMFRETMNEEGRVILSTSIFGAASSVCETLCDLDIVTMVMKKLQCLTSKSTQPQSFEINRFKDSILSATDFGLVYSEGVHIGAKYNSDVYISKSSQLPINYPKSLSHIFATGIEAATYLVKDAL